MKNKNFLFLVAIFFGCGSLFVQDNSNLIIMSSVYMTGALVLQSVDSRIADLINYINLLHKIQDREKQEIKDSDETNNISPS